MIIMCYQKHYIARLYARVDIVLIYGKHMLDCIISLQRDVLGHKIRLAPPLFIEVLEKVIVINLCVYKFSVGFWNCSECVILLHVVVSGAYCVVFVFLDRVCSMQPVSLDCPSWLPFGIL
jgi:hypothetical protein